MKPDLKSLLERSEGVSYRSLDEEQRAELHALLRFIPHTFEMRIELGGFIPIRPLNNFTPWIFRSKRNET